MFRTVYRFPVSTSLFSPSVPSRMAVQITLTLGQGTWLGLPPCRSSATHKRPGHRGHMYRTRCGKTLLYSFEADARIRYPGIGNSGRRVREGRREPSCVLVHFHIHEPTTMQPTLNNEICRYLVIIKPLFYILHYFYSIIRTVDLVTDYGGKVGLFCLN